MQTIKKNNNYFDKITKEIEKLTSPIEKEKDQRFWSLSVDKAGIGSAVIRFLPPAPQDGDDALPWARIFSHGFQGPTGKWFIENSLTTLGLKDPVSDYNSRLWNVSSDDASPERKQARAQKRKLGYISNIYIISDPKNPDNEGKVFLFRYGKKIFDKIAALTNPEFDNDTPVNVFDLYEGANFRLRSKTVDGYRNYDSSVFETPGPFLDSDKKLQDFVVNKQYSLAEFTSPSNFKTYDELKTRLDDVLENTEITNTPRNSTPSQKAPPVYVQKAVAPKLPDEDEDDELRQFRQLAEEA
jgi:hypothetical protein